MLAFTSRESSSKAGPVAVLLAVATLALAGCGSSGSTPPPPTCSDGVRNGGETAVDCGGPTCPRCATGLGCSGAADCLSGVCTAATCRAPACDDGVKNGTETGTDCGGGTCPDCADGLGCAGPGDCLSGVCSATLCVPPSCVDNVNNGAETDVDCGGPSCLGCAQGQTCLVGADCASQLCEGSTCVVHAAGRPCASNGQCGTGFCADGLCCDSACDGTCRACNLAGSEGSCTFVAPSLDPADECPASAAASCGNTGACDGAGACQRYGAATQCAPGSCTAGTETPPRYCDGAGTCAGSTPVGCAPFTCGSSACKTSCTLDLDCAATAYCAASSCQPKLTTGSACTRSSNCANGNCYNGVCCNSACAGTCQACDVAGSVGTCSNVPSGQQQDTRCNLIFACNGIGGCLLTNGQTCPSSLTCLSGNCVDGVCCNTACAGLCQACSMAKTGSPSGTCAAIPDGTDPDNECAGALVCNGAGACRP
jgi:hypothetical protein